MNGLETRRIRFSMSDFILIPYVFKSRILNCGRCEGRETTVIPWNTLPIGNTYIKMTLNDENHSNHSICIIDAHNKLDGCQSVHSSDIVSKSTTRFAATVRGISYPSETADNRQDVEDEDEKQEVVGKGGVGRGRGRRGGGEEGREIGGGGGGGVGVEVEVARRGRGKGVGRVDVDVWRVDSNIGDGVDDGVGVGVGVGVANDDDDDDDDDARLEIGKEFFEEIHENMTPNISNEQALNIYKEKIVRSDLVPFLFQRLLTERSPTEPRDPLLLGELKNVCVCTACHRC
ncbi:hypothetical protein V1478_010837 [Vespula squamosa]|uniref:Uncharacterized protein n=1 Tax=Vespula squamosa TaxID=30214 RepID=A0ABD2AI83_VESSQ